MQRFDIAVRSPTGNAWLLAVMPFIFGGELVWEAIKDETASFFKIPFADSELYGLAAGCALVAVFGLVWLVSLYVKPGRLVVDAEAGILRREKRITWKQDVQEGPLSDWQVRIQFFSEAYEKQGAFRRLELKGKQMHEVLLLNDVQDGHALCQALAGVKDRLGGYEIEIKKPAAKTA